MAYTGPIYRGVDYNPTWPGWTQGPGEQDPNQRLQTFDSDMANDAFASLWGKGYQASPAGNSPFSVPFNNGSNYRDDLGTIARDGFNLVRLYNWDVARGTSPSQQNKGLDHLNFLNYAKELGLKVIVPVSDFFLNDTEFSWKGVTPNSNYSFGSAPAAIQDDFRQFVASITDPSTGKIHSSVILSVGNEGDIGEDLQASHTTASNFLARTNWWIYNLHQQINGAGANGPDGSPVINGAGGPIVQISATFANADQGGTNGSWFKALLSGVQTGQATPNKWVPTGGTTFEATVKGLKAADPTFESYYFNSFNIGQSTNTPPFGNGIQNTLGLLDSGASPWPGESFNVPVLLMEVFTPNRFQYTDPANQAVAAVNEVKDLEAYIASKMGGTSGSTTNLMGYNYFEFNDEPHANKQVGLYQYTTDVQNAHTGTSGIFYISRGGFADFTIPVSKLTPTPGPDGKTLVQAWTQEFPAHRMGTNANDVLVGSAAAETLQGAGGSDNVDGGQGFDTARFGQNASAYTLRTTAGSSAITVQDKVGTEGTDTLNNIENIRFANTSLPTEWVTATASLAVNQILKLVDLYTAGLNRAPDALGFDYWGSRLAEGATLSDIAKSIFSSAEAAPIFSPINSNTVFVNQAYQAALGRAPDAAGAAYWINELNTGHIQRTDFFTSLIAGAASAADAAHIANEEAVGAHFALTQGLNNVTWARTVQSGVNGTAASVTAANAQTDAFAATAATAAGTELVVQIVGVVP